ncbi:MAG: aspartate aminotransferase family protein, partial [Syntrophobacterales bacterium CG_4_8_14_3_um_filter_49_14]
PVGAMLAADKIASAFTPGAHASTFGGNPLAMAAALATLETILKTGILENCRRMGVYFLKKLEEIKGRHPAITAVRGRGLMVALELGHPGEEIVNRCLKRGLLINCTNGNILRFLPPLITVREDIDRAVEIF